MNTSNLKRFEQIELQAKLLNYFLGSNKSNINQSADLLCHVSSTGSCSQFGLILHPHLVAVPYHQSKTSKFFVAGVHLTEELCSNPWRNSFVVGNIYDRPSQTTQKRPKFGGVVIK